MFDLSLQLTVLTDRLTLAYAVTNRLPEPAFVFVLARLGMAEPLPHRAYAALIDGDQVLRLYLGPSPLPKGVFIEAAVLPLARRLAAGQALSDHIDVPLPAREWHAYARPDYPATQARLIQAARVRFETCCFREADLFFKEERRDWPGCFSVDGYPAYLLQAEERLKEPIPVWKRL